VESPDVSDAFRQLLLRDSNLPSLFSRVISLKTPSETSERGFSRFPITAGARYGQPQEPAAYFSCTSLSVRLPAALIAEVQSPVNPTSLEHSDVEWLDNLIGEKPTDRWAEQFLQRPSFT
jgi:hypothetical protein